MNTNLAKYYNEPSKYSSLTDELVSLGDGVSDIYITAEINIYRSIEAALYVFQNGDNYRVQGRNISITKSASQLPFGEIQYQ